MKYRMIKGGEAPPNICFMLLLRSKRSIYSNRTISTFLLKLALVFPNTIQLYS